MKILLSIRKPFTKVQIGETRHVECGSATKDTFVKVTQEDGENVLVKTGTFNQHDYIQSFASDVDVNKLVQRYANGDVTALGTPGGFYADVSGMPQNLAEVFSLNQRSRSFFDNLPEDLKKDFGSYQEFMESFSSKDKFLDLNTKVNAFFEAKRKPVAQDLKLEGGEQHEQK